MPASDRQPLPLARWRRPQHAIPRHGWEALRDFCHRPNHVSRPLEDSLEVLDLGGQRGWMRLHRLFGKAVSLPIPNGVVPLSSRWEAGGINMRRHLTDRAALPPAIVGHRLPDEASVGPTACQSEFRRGVHVANDIEAVRGH